MSELMISISGVRGIVGETLTPETAVGMAASFGEVASEGPVLLATDGRTSGPLLRSACVAGLAGVGREVIDLGVCTTPTTEMAVIERGAAGAVIISASHNPAEWNGLKFLGPDGTFVRQKTLDAVIARWRSGKHRWAAWETTGTVGAWEGAADRHIERVLDLDAVDADAVRAAGLSVVLDTICASGAVIAPKLLDRLGCNVTTVNGEVTGRFPRKPEPVPENIAAVGDVVRSSGASVGLVLDPDADRLALIDEHGEPIGEEYTLALAVYAVRRVERGGPVVLNMSTSRMVDDLGADLGFPVYRSAVGEINVVDEMVRTGSNLGGEGNGGVIYGRLHYGRDGILGMALVLTLLAHEKVPLSELVNRIPRYRIVKERAEVPRERQEVALARIAASGRSDGTDVDTRDGVKLIWKDRWLHVRRSNTEPIVRIIAEAPTEKLALELCGNARSQLAEAGA